MGKHIPYSRQSVDRADISRVVTALHAEYLTTGPRVEEFERAFAKAVGAEHAVAVSSGTAALHASMAALGIGPGDEVIVPAMTFAATANCIVYQGGTPIFCDVEPNTLLIDPIDANRKITSRTRAIIAMDYAGQPCDYTKIGSLARAANLMLVADACHSLGGHFIGMRVGRLADLTAFSFHPVKVMTTGEGGMVTTDFPEFAKKMRSFRNHGINHDHKQRAEFATWQYAMTSLGYNYRITDFQCALGMSQLPKVEGWVGRRREIADMYDELLADFDGVRPLGRAFGRGHAFHLYVVRIDSEITPGRDAIFARMRKAGIGVNVHYIPAHLHPYYMTNFGTCHGDCPAAEKAYDEILSLPIFPGMADSDVVRVVAELKGALARGSES